MDACPKSLSAVATSTALLRRPTQEEAEAAVRTLIAWAGYCQARNALLLYAWAPLREHCLALLDAYLARSRMFQPSRTRVIVAVAETLVAAKAGRRQ